MADVWVVEEGEYEQRGVVCVALTAEGAERYLRDEVYGPPYVVTWEPVQYEGEDYATLVGHFTPVPGYSAGHTATYEMTRYTAHQ